MKKPPLFAKWLLARLAPSTSDSLLGDLEEEYTSGRSPLWYWRQTFNIVAAATSRQVRRHPALALRAVTLGWVFLWIFSEYLLRPISDLDHALFVRGVMDVRGWWPHSPAMLFLVWYLWCAASGWVIARFHDRQLLLVFVGTIMMYHLAILGPALMYVAQPSTKGFIMHTIVSLGLMPASILIGGLGVETRQMSAASKVSGQ
jgi:hypothetical protein